MIYLDNGATSFPKPRQVTDAVLEAMTQYCANPGRSSHFLAARTAQEIYKTRAALALLLGLDDPGRILFTKNCTEALNLALRGILRKGDHVGTSSMEHNAVLRPLKALEKEGVETTIVRCDPAGRLDPQKIRQAIRPETRMIVVTAASNVTGTIMPLEEVGRIALRQGVLFCVDGAQGAGHMILDAKRAYRSAGSAWSQGAFRSAGDGFFVRSPRGFADAAAVWRNGNSFKRAGSCSGISGKLRGGHSQCAGHHRAGCGGKADQ